MKFKRMLAIILCFAIVFSTMSFNVFAVESMVGTEAELKTALAEGGTIVLSNDITVAEQLVIPEGVEVTIDLNGKTITGELNGASTTNHIYVMANYGTLTITDSGEDGAIISRGVYNYGKLTLENGKIDACDCNGGYAVNNESGSVFIMNGGSVTADYEDGDAPVSGNYDATALDVPENCTATLNSGTISNAGNFTFAISVEGELIVPEDSTVSVTGVHGTVAVMGGEANIAGGTFKLVGSPNVTDSLIYVPSGTANITGGSFDASETLSSSGRIIGAYDSGKVTVNGGTFTSNGWFDFADSSIENVTVNDAICVDCDDTVKSYVAENATITLNGESYTAPAEAGSGTEEDPILINTAEDLIALRDAVNNGDNYAGKYVKLNADIDLGNTNWTPIGSASDDHGFMGNFDGNGHTIFNLTIEDPALDADGYAYAGLFGVTEGTDKDNQNTIENLTIENVTISTTGHIVAAAIAYPYYTIVDNVKVCGDINITGGDYTAGVLAYTRRCVDASNLYVEGAADSTISGRYTVGGVISDIQMNGGLTANYSNFNASGVTVSGTNNVGGISGIISSQTLDTCSVKNVTLDCDDARVGTVAGSLGGVPTISDVTVENVSGASAIIGGTYQDGKSIEAKVGDKYYAKLSDAVNAACAASGEVNLTLLADVTGNVTLTEKVGLYLTIDGAGKTMNGSITFNALSDINDNRRITIKDINFVNNDDAKVDFISSVNTNHYPRVTVDGCSFTGSGDDGDVAVRLKSSHSVVITDCTGTGLHSFLQNTSGWNLTIADVTVNDSKGGLALGTVQGVTISGCEIDVDTYGIRLDAQYNNNAVIESNNVSAFIPVVVRKAEVDSNITINGENTMTASNEDGIWCAIGTSEYEENGNLPTASTGKINVTLNDETLDASGVYGKAWDGETIASVSDFIAFAKASQGGDSFSGKIVKLTSDIDFKGANFLEIAEDGTVVTDYRIPKFSGTFDGDGHTIKNFNFVVKNTGKHNIMMFSQDNMWAYIKNVNIENVTVDIADISGQTRVTALANRVNAGGMTDAAIKNVHVKNFKIVSNNVTSDDFRIGGLVYFAQGSQLIAKDCSITDFEVDVNKATLIGGAVAVVKSKCDFENVDVIDAVFSVDSFNKSGIIGGFVAQTQDKGTDTTFSGCDVTNMQMTLGYSPNNLGGFVGSIGSVCQFYNCTVTGSITSEDDTNDFSIGGFVGDLGWNGMFEPNVQHEFNECVTDVDITAVNANVGGFIGDSTVAGYPDRFMPSYFNSCDAKGNVKTENGVAGGFVGRGDRGIFKDCSASGNVEGRIAGGFWGELYPKAMAESTGGWSYQGKEVTHTDTNAKSIVLEELNVSGTVTGTEYAAELIGYMKDIYVNADGTNGYATPVVFTNNNTSECNRYPYMYTVATKEELNEVLATAKNGDTILFTADIDYGTDQLKIEKAITLDLGGFTLTTRNAYGGMSVKNNPTIKNGTIVHASNTAAIKVWNATAFEDLVIDVQGKGDANKTIGGIVLQEGSATRVDSIKNVTIKGVALTNGIETYNCGTAANDVIGSMDNVTIDAVGTGMLISAPCGTATNCDIKGGKTGIEIWIKGTYSAKLDLVDCDVTGEEQAVYAHDEFKNGVVNNGTLELTFDANTEFDAGETGAMLTLVNHHDSDITVPDVLTENAIANVNGKYFDTITKAVNAANGIENGAVVELLSDIELGEKLTITGNVTISGEKTITRADAYTGTLFAVNAEATLTLDGGLVIDGGNEWTLDEELYNKALNREVTGVTWEQLITSDEEAPNATAAMFVINGSVVANDVTIQNNYSTKDSNGGDGGIFKVEANATLTMTGATVDHIVTYGANSVAHISTNAVWTINEGTLITDTFAGKNGGVCRNDSGHIVMNGGTVEKNRAINTNGTFVMLYKGTMKMNGGKICSNTGVSGTANGRCAPIYGHSTSTFVMTAGEICHNTGISYGGVDVPSSIKVEISGGYIGDNISVIGNTNADINGNSYTVITGGTFTQDVTKWLAPDLGLVYNETTGTYGLTEDLYEYNGTAYNSLAEVIATIASTPVILAADDTTPVVKVLSSHKVDEPIIITTDLVLDLNEKTITGANNIYPVIRVQNEANVTVKNGAISNNDYVFVLGSSDKTTAGNLTIESGKYHGATTVASVTKGTLTILGGEFSVDPYKVDGQEDNYNYLLNCYDESYRNGEATIVIKGGTFNKFNPANNAAEGANTNFVANGYTIKDNNDDTYSVVACEAKIDEVYYATLKDAFAAAQDGDTITLVIDANLNEMIVITKKITLDLNGKTVTGTDTTEKNFSLIDNRGELVVTGNGKMTLTATVNSGWGRYSAVIANNPGGKLIIENGTFEHLGGTDMAYGIDNLTNGKGTYAETIINGGTIKSTYRAVRQFLNGVEADNILTVNAGTIEGANKSIWMQDPSKNANTGKLTVNEGATLNGDVYLFVTAGSTEWPVEVSIAKSAVNGEVISANVPLGYVVVEENGVYGVNKITPDTYTVEAIADKTEVRFNNGNPDKFAVKYVITGGDVTAASAQFNYNAELFKCLEYPDANGKIRIDSYESLPTDENGETLLKELHFTVKKNVEVDTTYTFVASNVEIVSDEFAANSGAQEGFVENLKGATVKIIAQYNVTLPTDDSLAGNTYVDKNKDYSATINNFDEDMIYTIKYTMGGVEQEDVIVTKDNVVDGGFVIKNVSGNIEFKEVTSKLNCEIVILEGDYYLNGCTLVMVKNGVSTGYTYNGAPMYRVERYEGLTGVDTSIFTCGDINEATTIHAILVDGIATEDSVRTLLEASTQTSTKIGKSFDVNGSGQLSFSDAMTAFYCYGKKYERTDAYMETYLSADVNTDFIVDTEDYNKTMEAYWADIDNSENN